MHVLGRSGSTTGGDYVYQNYTFSFNDGDRTRSLPLHSIDDNIVEPDETYSLTITLVSSSSCVKICENDTARVAILDEDGSYIVVCVTCQKT